MKRHEARIAHVVHELLASRIAFALRYGGDLRAFPQVKQGCGNAVKIIEFS